MYAQYYQLQSDPFRLTPDPDFSFTHQSYGKAWAYMQYALRQGEGFLVITGRPGSGKTTLIRSLLAELDKQRIASAVLVSTRFDAADLVPMVAHAFGLQVDGADKVTILKRLEEFLVRHGRGGRPALLLIDEAQGLSADTLQELYRLTNLYEGDTPLLQVFLIGQEQLRSVLHAAGWGELKQRLIAACHLEPLDLEQTQAYIRHRLLRSGWRGNPQLSDDAVRLIHHFSEGLPRRINTMCSRLLLFGSVHNKRALDGRDVRLVVEELREERLHVDNDSGGASPAESSAAVPLAEEPAPEASPAAIRARSATDIEWMDKVGNDAAGLGQIDIDLAEPDEAPAPITTAMPEDPFQTAASPPNQPPADVAVDLHIPGPRRYDLGANAEASPIPGKAQAPPEPATRRRGGRLFLMLVVAIGLFVLFRNFLPFSVNDTPPPARMQPATTPAAQGELPSEPARTSLPPAQSQAQAPKSAINPLDKAAVASRSAPAAPESIPANATAAAPRTPIEPPDAAVLDPGPEPGTAAAPSVAPASPATLPEPAAASGNAGTQETTAAIRPPSAAADPAAGPQSEPPPKTAAAMQSPPVAGAETPSTAAALPVPSARPQPSTTSPPESNTEPASGGLSASSDTPDAAGQNAQIQALLRQANIALEDYQLTIPEEQSAYTLYRQVLRLDPGNEAAQRGIEEVVQRYVWLARRSLERGDYRQVEQYAERGARLDPDNEELRAIRRLLAIERERPGLNR